MRWHEFAAAAPELATLGEQRFESSGLCLVGTLRRDGSPRISPVEPYVAAGHLFLGMMPNSRKALDLLRDPRVVVHSVTCDREGTDGDFKLYAAVGAFLGWKLLPLVILLSSLVGVVFGALQMFSARRGWDWKFRFHFGPYLALAGVIAMFWGAAIMQRFPVLRFTG